MKKICLVALAFFIVSNGFVSAASDSRANEKLSAVDDITNQRVGVLLGSVDDVYARQAFPNAQIAQYTTLADIVLAVKTDKVDFALSDDVLLKAILLKDDSLQILGKVNVPMDYGIGFNKSNNGLKKDFNAYLAEIKRNGIYDDMVYRWIDQGGTAMPSIDTKEIKGTINVGIANTGLPFEAIVDNELVGFDVELVKRFAKYKGMDVRFMNMDFGSLIASLISKKVDMIASSIYITDERKKKINFSDSYFSATSAVFALQSNITQKSADIGAATLISGLKDLKHKKIGVLQGSTHDTFAHKLYPEADILQYRTLSDVVLAVKSQKVDAGFQTDIAMPELLSVNQDLAIIGDTFETMDVAFAFNKKNKQLTAQFNLFMTELKSSGLYKEMTERWIVNQESTMPDIPTPNRSGVLIAGHLSDSGFPFDAIKNNQSIGLNIELAKRFAAYLGKDLRLEDMDFGSLIPALAAGKIDVIAATVMTTEERKLKIDFGTAFYQIGVNAFALKANILNQVANKTPDYVEVSFLQGVLNSFQSNIMQEKRYLLLWDGFKVTILISILATILGTVIGGGICFMRMSENFALNIPAKIYISFVRGTPVLVILMLMFYVVFGSVSINPVTVAIIAFGINFGAYVAEIFRSGIEGVDKGQMEAGIAMGFNKVKTFIYIILPQAIRRVLPIYKGEFISLVKMTSIVGYIAVQDLTKASDIIRSRTFDAFFPLIMIAVLYFIISWGLIQFLDHIEKVTDPKYKRKMGKK